MPLEVGGDVPYAEPIAVPAIDLAGPTCAWAGCDLPIPSPGEPGYHVNRRYCDEHKEANKKKRGKGKGDAAPTNVNVNLGGSASGGKSAADKRVKVVAAGATQMANTIGLLVIMGGDEQCGAAIVAGADAWGKALGDLSRYQPVLEKIFAPGEALTGQGFAWIAVLAATAGILIPVLNHHGVVSDELALKFTAGTMAMSGVTVDSADVG